VRSGPTSPVSFGILLVPSQASDQVASEDEQQDQLS